MHSSGGTLCQSLNTLHHIFACKAPRYSRADALRHDRQMLKKMAFRSHVEESLAGFGKMPCHPGLKKKHLLTCLLELHGRFCIESPLSTVLLQKFLHSIIGLQHIKNLTVHLQVLVHESAKDNSQGESQVPYLPSLATELAVACSDKHTQLVEVPESGLQRSPKPIIGLLQSLPNCCQIGFRSAFQDESCQHLEHSSELVLVGSQVLAMKVI